MAYDPKRPRPSLPAEDEPAPVDGLIELTDPPQPVGEPTTGSPDPAAESGPRSALGSAPGSAPADGAERSRDDMASGTAGPGEAAAAVGSGVPPALVAAAVAAVAALVAIILLRRRRARG